MKVSVQPANLSNAFDAVSFSHTHPNFLKLAQVRVPPVWVPRMFHRYFGQYIGMTGLVIDVEMGKLSKQALFSVVFESLPDRPIAVYSGKDLDFESPYRLTAKEKSMIGI